MRKFLSLSSQFCTTKDFVLTRLFDEEEDDDDPSLDSSRINRIWPDRKCGSQNDGFSPTL